MQNATQLPRPASTRPPLSIARRFLFFCWLTLAVSLATAGHAQAARFQIVGIDFNPKSVDVSATSATVTLTVTMQDDIGIYDIEGAFYSPSGNPSYFYMTLTAGTPQNGTFQTSIVVPTSAERGVYTLGYLQPEDIQYTSTNISASSFPAGSPTQLTIGPTGQPPTIATTAASSVTPTTATLSAQLTTNGNNGTLQFNYGTTTAYGSVLTSQTTYGDGTYYGYLTGLTPNTTYHFQAILTYNGGTVVKGGDLTFTTPPPYIAPTVTTGGYSQLAATSVSLSGTVNPNGFDTYYYFQVGTDTNYSNAYSGYGYAGAGTAVVNAVGTVTGLTPNTTYYYRLVAYNNGGYSYGNPGSTFTTPGTAAASITTVAPTNVTMTSATMNYSVNPNGVETQLYIMYGTSSGNYNLGYAGSIDIGSGTSLVSSGFTVNNLIANTTYYYRAYASGAYGTLSGTEATFTTPAGNAPNATTQAASNLTSTSATLNGSVNANGSVTTYYFEYGPTTAYGSTTYTYTGNGGSSTTAFPVSPSISGLSPNTTYHYQLVASSNVGTTLGGDLTFTTTASGTAPTVLPLSAASVTSSGATLKGQLNPNGFDTTYYFQYGTTTTYGASTGSYDAGAGTTLLTESVGVTSLNPGTLYHFRMVATNTGGTVLGTDGTFTTTATGTVPSATILSPTNISSSGATLNGQVNPNGVAATYHFEYGTSTAYGSSTTETSAGSGTSNVSVQAGITGLAQGTTYYYRLVAKCANGTTPSAYTTFTTSGTVGSPTVTTLAASNLTATTATLNASVNPNGVSTTVYFRYGTSSGNYTSGTLGGINAGSGTTAVTENYAVTGLTPNTTYYYQAFISGSYGSLFGSELTFVTPAANAPITTISAADSITTTTATLHGSVNPNGSATTYHFEYGTTTSYGTSTASSSAGSGSTAASVLATLTGLTPNTTYHFRLVASNGNGTGNLSDLTFVTSPTAVAPTATTVTAISVTSVGATLRGSVNPKGTPTNYYFQYGATTSYGTSTSSASAGSGTTASTVSTTITSLLLGTTFHYRVVASNSAGTTYGADMTFTTGTAPPPASTTTGYTGISATGVVLNGQLNPNGLSTTYYFQYGLTTAYGSKTTTTSAGVGTVVKTVSATLTGLVAGTTYHYRLVAVSTAGTVYGTDVIFVTYTTTVAWRGFVDFNGDGFADYITWDPTNGQTKIWFMNGSTVVGSAVGPTIPAGWVLAAVADCDGDGHPDLILYRTATRQTSIYYLNGTTLLRSANGPTLTAGYTLAGVWDFNGDGQVDYVLVNASGQTAIWYLTGNGTTLSTTAVGPAIPAGYSLAYVVDFNGDGHPDFILVNNTTRQSVIWYLNGVTKTSTANGPVLSLGYELAAVMDFNHDGHLDFLLSNPSSRRNLFDFLNGLSVSSSAYGPATDVGFTIGGIIAPAPVSAVITATTVGATSVHLVGSVQPAGSALSVHFDYGLTTNYGTSTAVQNIVAGTTLVSVSADVTGLTAGAMYHCRMVYVSGGSTLYGADQIFWILPSYVNRFDFNGDHSSDFLLFNPATLQLSAWYLNSSYVTTGTAVFPTLPAGWIVAAFADFNNDGKPDLLIYNPRSRGTQIWYMNGVTVLSKANGPVLPLGYILGGTGDFDGNGTQDWVICNPISGQTQIWYFAGAALVSTVQGPTLTPGYILAGIADFNHDGHPDWVLYNPFNRQTYIWYLNGATYVSTATGPVISIDYDLAWVGDFNGDGNPDYVLVDVCSKQTVIMTLNGVSILSIVAGPVLTGGYGLATGPITNPLPYAELYSWVSARGSTPRAGLIQASDGNFYGTTSTGGAYLAGTIFRVTSAGALTQLYSFNPANNGIHTPYAGLIQASDGNFYGTCTLGGNGYGGIFKMTLAGGVTPLHALDFTNDGGVPYGSLLQASDGLLYGTAWEGGAHGYGTIFNITTAGAFTKLFDFTGVEGAEPRSALIQDSAGNFYGTGIGIGGGGEYGMVFKRAANGTVTKLHAFTGTDGSYPYSALLLASDGNLYGTIEGGGLNGRGGVFTLSTTGANFNLIHSFNYTDGADPGAALIEDCAGDLFGTTSYGGPGSTTGGTAFKITKAGAVTSLHYFPAATVTTDGNTSYSTLFQGSDGNLYGTTSAGGANGWGTIFRLTAP